MAAFNYPCPGIGSTAKRVLASLGLVTIIALSTTAAQAQPDFITFESGQVRPLAMTPDGSTLLAVNTPDNTLEVFSIVLGELTHTDSIPVGMEPVAVAARNNTEVWVVNFLSDSVSVVDLSLSPPRVVRTLLVGDEPRDIVFAGTGGTDRAFISTAHRGQHLEATGRSAQLTTAGVGRADVWVFNATNLGTALGGTPVDVLTFFADTPRALAVTPDRSTVYVAAFYSGNQTTTVTETVVCNGFQVSGGTDCGTGAPGGVPGPDDNANGDPAPETGVIVKFDQSSGEWRDAIGRDWSGAVPFTLPDHDVFSFNANTLASINTFDHVGTTLFNMVVNPDPLNPKVYVTNFEQPNHLRFEGPGNHGGSTVQGHLSESRITVLDPSGPSATPRHLNKHINYANLHTNAGADHNAIEAQKTHSLATPMQPVVNSAGDTLYLAAFGSARIGVFATAQIENDSFDPTVDSANYIDTGGGPSGLVLDEANERLYVLTRFANRVEVIDLNTNDQVETHNLHNPEPTAVVDGRPFLYDANLTSGNGEASCSSCHIFGDMDHLAWNLGDPDGVVTTNSQPQAVNIPLGNKTTFHPMKGPMTTQTLRGLATHGSMHWRGDRVDGFFGLDPCSEPEGAACSEEHGFNNFIVAFEGLVGMQGTITATQMQQFTDFALQIMLPPNPVRPLDRSFTAGVGTAPDIYGTPDLQGTITDTVSDCQGCHRFEPSAGFFGSGGGKTFEGEPQVFKVAHLRNVYQKVGMFLQSGNQVRGFGILHDGSVDTVKTFLNSGPFQLNNTQENALQQFVLQFDTDLAPMVGQQVTLTSTNGAVANPRINEMVAQAGTHYNSLMLGGDVPECDVIVKGVIAGESRGAVRLASGQFQPDRADDTLLTLNQVRNLVGADTPATFTCVPPGSGVRMGINRDRDTVLDGDDNCPATFNSNQRDKDHDGIGNACDPDYVAPVGC